MSLFSNLHHKPRLQSLEVITLAGKKLNQRSRSTASERQFVIRENIFEKSTRNKKTKWFPGIITKKISEYDHLLVKWSLYIYADHRRNYILQIPEICVHHSKQWDYASRSSVTAIDSNAKIISDSVKDVTSQTSIKTTEAVQKEQILSRAVKTTKEFLTAIKPAT